MSTNYEEISELDLGAGIDSQSAETRIQPGFSESLVNVNPTPDGRIEKRMGRQSHKGHLPVRVESLTYLEGDVDNVILNLDGAISLGATRNSPLVVYGKTSSPHAEGDFTNSNTSHYYPGFKVTQPIIIEPGMQTITMPGSVHGLGTKYIEVLLLQAEGLTTFNNTEIWPDEVRVNGTSFDIEIDIMNETGEAFGAFLAIASREEEASVTFISSTTSVADGEWTVSVPASTHQLENFNIQASLHAIGMGGNLTKILPEEVRVSAATGNVEIDFINGTGGGIDVIVILHRCPLQQRRIGTINEDEIERSVVIGDVESAFVSYRVYFEDMANPGTLQQVLVDSASYDSSANELTLKFVNREGIPVNYYIYYDYAQIYVNSIQLTGSEVVSSYIDMRPQLSIFGLDHSQIYGRQEEGSRAGWVNHIDLYKSDIEQRLITGLGGVLHAETDNVPDLNMAHSLHVSIRGRVEATSIIGPFFQNPSTAVELTSGSLIGDNVDEEGRIIIESMTWANDRGRTDIRLRFVNGLTYNIYTSLPQEALIDLEDLPFPYLNGTFPIINQENTEVDGNDIIIHAQINHPLIDSSDWDIEGEGKAAIRSATIYVQPDINIIPGDIITSETLPAPYEAHMATGNMLIIKDVRSPLTVSAGVRLIGRRKTNTIPLRDLDGNRTVENIVIGDSIRVSGQKRMHRVVEVNPTGNTFLNITKNGDTSTITVFNNFVTYLTKGSIVTIIGASEQGQHEVLDILNDREFVIATPPETNYGYTGQLQGNYIRIDETIEAQDSLNNEVSWQVAGRFIPIDVPEATQSLIETTAPRLFTERSYTNQEIVRSTLINDAMYLTDGLGSLHKYDGIHVQRAGLYRWQPRLFISPDTSTDGKINLGNPFMILGDADSSKDNEFIAEEAAETRKFMVGEQVEDSRDGTIYRIEKIDTTNGTITVDRRIEATANEGRITRTTELAYYARLTLIDANGYIVASATTGIEESTLRLGADASVRIRLLAPPAIGHLDYDRMEITLFRRAGADPTYYKIRSIRVPFDVNNNYIDILDTDAPDSLFDWDDVTGRDLDGLGQAWGTIPKMKYVTSSNGRLLGANITSHPRLDLQWRRRRLDITTDDLLRAGNSVLTIRRDDSSSQSTTDMISTVRYEFVSTSTSDPIKSISLGVNQFTIEIEGSSAEPGQWIYLSHSTESSEHSLQLTGWYQISSVDGELITVNAQIPSDYVITSADVDSCTMATDPYDVPVLLGIDGNYNTRRGQEGSLRNLPISVAIGRLGNAINASMRCVDTTIGSMSNFRPWIVANSGSEFEAGQLVLEQPFEDETTFAVELDDLDGSFSIYGNSILRSSQALVESQIERFPSRVLISLPAFAEIFDAPLEAPERSMSAVDINPSDGQEVTGIFPFFSDSAFGSAQKSSLVLVFKSSSIYVLDVTTRDVQKLDSRGLGCTAPFAVTYTKDAVMFVNSSGIYRINQQLTVEDIAQFLQRDWRNEVNRDALSLMTAHHAADQQKYIVSFPKTGELKNSGCFVYDHTREYRGQGLGSWTRWEAVPATGWVNQEQSSYMASTLGRVFLMRDRDNERPFRDDADPIEASATLRAMDFGIGGIRKVFGHLTINYRTEEGTTEGTVVEAATDMSDNFLPADPVTISNDKKVQAIQFSLPRRHGHHLQIKLSNEKLDEGMEIASLSYAVAGATQQGMTQAKTT